VAAATNLFHEERNQEQQRREQDLEWGTTFNPMGQHGDEDAPIGAGNVWAKLVEASEHRSCSSPPCTEVSPLMVPQTTRSATWWFHAPQSVEPTDIARPLWEITTSLLTIASLLHRLRFLFFQGRHIHQPFDDFGQEMAHVDGAVVVRRPDLIGADSSLLAPADNLDFAATLMPYFPLFRSSLCPRYDFWRKITWGRRLRAFDHQQRA